MRSQIHIGKCCHCQLQNDSIAASRPEPSRPKTHSNLTDKHYTTLQERGTVRTHGETKAAGPSFGWAVRYHGKPVSRRNVPLSDAHGGVRAGELSGVRDRDDDGPLSAFSALTA